ncbi:unnamed protein product [Calypogeia fissa]
MEDSALSKLRQTELMGDSTPLSIVLAVVLGGVMLLSMKQLWSLYSASRASKVDGARLPKGSFGWPIIGESFAFASNPKAYAQSRVKKYGGIFKSSLFLRPVILGATPEFARFVTTNRKLFVHTLPDVLINAMGPKSFISQNGPYHMALKKIVSSAIGVESLQNHVQTLETIILENLGSWERAGTVAALDATQKLSWDASNWLLFNDRHTTSTPEGKENFENFKLIMRMVINLPLKLPGTAYTVGMKARTALMAYFRTLIDERRGSTEGVYFAALLAGRDDPDCREQLKDFDDNALAENIFLLNFTAHDTNSTTLLWILKFLVDYPDVFRRLQAEQQEILNSKDRSVKGPRLTWEDTRKMVYTHKFLQELQRFTSLVPANFAEATEDVKFGDYLIPKGWMVITLTNVIHNDPANYPDLSFNPDRFDVIPKPFTYLPFSGGPHMCPGIEFAKLVGCIFIHHITTTYMHERAGRDKGLEYDGFFPRPKGGYPINFRAGKL